MGITVPAFTFLLASQHETHIVEQYARSGPRKRERGRVRAARTLTLRSLEFRHNLHFGYPRVASQAHKSGLF